MTEVEVEERAHSYWDNYVTFYDDPNFGTSVVKYFCPNGCVTGSGNPKKLNPKLVKKKGKNTGRSFITCNEKSYNGSRPGCGAFYWLSEEPNPNALAKRQREEATYEEPQTKKGKVENGELVTGQIAAMPSAVEKQVADNTAMLGNISAMLQSLIANQNK